MFIFSFRISQYNFLVLFKILMVFSARFLSKDGRLLSIVLPPPPITTGQQPRICCAHAYCPMYGLMYVLVNQEEIWVYYTKYDEQINILRSVTSILYHKCSHKCSHLTDSMQLVDFAGLIQVCHEVA